MARRIDGDFGEGTVLDALEDGSYLVAWNEEDVAAKLETAELMPFGSGMGMSTERRQRVAPAFILNNFLLKTAIPSNDLSRVQMVVRDGADVNCTDADGNSPLNLAVSNGASVVLIQFLISRGAHVNFVGAAGSALQIAAIQDNVEAVRCLLAHGADAGLVDLDACAEESATLLKESLVETESSPASLKAALTAEENLRYGTECFCQLLPALLSAMSETQSPKQQKRVLMVLSFLVQRALEPQLSALTPQQLGALLSQLRTLLASPSTLEHFCALRMLGAALKAWPKTGSTARRHGVDLLLEQLAARTLPAADGDAAGHSSRARNISLKASDVTLLAQKTSALLKAVPADAAEDDVQSALAALPARSGKNFVGVVQELATLLLGKQPPSAHELQRSGTIAWLVAELGGARPSELRHRWADFERAFGVGSDTSARALEQLLQLLHNTLVASEKLPVHVYTSSNEVAHSLKPLAETMQVCLHPIQSATAPGNPSAVPAVTLSIDPLVRVAELQQHLLRSSTIADTAYEAFCTRLIGCVVEDRPRAAANDAPFRRATVAASRTVTPLKLRVHTLVYDDGREVDVIMATREYRIVGRVPQDELARARANSRESDSGTVADPEARIHTVNITCPEGLPVDLFLENVLSEIRRSLRQAEPGCAPMTRSINEDYGWRDRGWERGGAQFERAVAEKLRENGMAAVARRQTKHEAETLMNRLQNMVMVAIEVERPTAANDDSEDGGERFSMLCRVQGLVAAEANSSSEQAHWLNATVVDIPGPNCSLVYDDGSFEAAVPAYRVRPVPQPESNKRLNPLAAIFMSFEQFLSSREERRAELDLVNRDSTPANLRRTLSSFHLGRSQQVGHVQSEELNGEVPSRGGSTPMDTGDETAGGLDIAAFDIAPMRLEVRLSLGAAMEPPKESGSCFDEGLTLLHCLQRIRETTPSGRIATQEAQELGYHPGVTCDRTGQCPIVGNRYKLNNENYDVCEAEYLKMPSEEREKYGRIPPPYFRKPKGCGPAVWHLWYSIEVASQSPAASAGTAGGSAASGVVGASGGSSPSGSTSLRCGDGQGSVAAQVPWTAKEVEAGLLSGRLEAEQVLRELRRAVSGTDLRLSETATRMLSESVGGRCMAPLCSAQLMAAYREVCDVPRAAPTAVTPVPLPAHLNEIRDELSCCGAVPTEFSEALLLLWLLSCRMLRDDGCAQPEGVPPSTESSTAERMTHFRKLFMSSRLSAKLLQQLTDALAVSSGALPQ